MKMTTFQLASLAIFAVLLLVGIGIFSTFGGVTNASKVGKVIVWGTMDGSIVEQTLSDVRLKDKTMEDVTYIEKNTKTYVPDLINAMATGNGPDLFMISQDQITSFTDKIGVIPYGAVSQLTYTDSYIDEAQLFLTPDGSLALPFAIDPMVLYWNRATLASAGYSKPPEFWNDFFEMSPKLTQLDASSNIKKSAVALGGWSNVLYAKHIVATLFMQAGDPIVLRNEAGKPMSTLGAVQNTNTSANENPTTSALQFYTEFANPTKTTYSWNRSLPLSQDAFVAGDLALYFGFASDYPTLKDRNPNLHLGISQMPQIQNTGVTLAFGQITGFAIPRTTKNASGALLAAQKLTSKSAISSLVSFSNLPSVRRDVTVDTSKDAAKSVFAKAALTSRGWLDPDPLKSDIIFQDMIESVISGKAQPSAAVFNANQALQTLLKTNVIQTR